MENFFIINCWKEEAAKRVTNVTFSYMLQQLVPVRFKSHTFPQNSVNCCV